MFCVKYQNAFEGCRLASFKIAQTLFLPSAPLTRPLRVFSDWKIYCRLVNFLWPHFSGPLMACCVLYQSNSDRPLKFSQPVPRGYLTHTHTREKLHRVSSVPSDKSPETGPLWFTALEEVCVSGTNGPTRHEWKVCLSKDSIRNKWALFCNVNNLISGLVTHCVCVCACECLTSAHRPPLRLQRLGVQVNTSQNWTHMWLISVCNPSDVPFQQYIQSQCIDLLSTWAACNFPEAMNILLPVMQFVGIRVRAWLIRYAAWWCGKTWFSQAIFVVLSLIPSLALWKKKQLLWVFLLCTMQSVSPGQNVRKTTVPQEQGWPPSAWRACQPRAVSPLLFLSSGSCQVGDIFVCLFCKCICFL